MADTLMGNAWVISQVGDRFIERLELTERQLGRKPRRTAVPVDHDARRVSCSVRDPSLGVASGEV
jgi:hypothetical protein